jgi:hypothetical protein
LIRHCGEIFGIKNLRELQDSLRFTERIGAEPCQDPRRFSPITGSRRVADNTQPGGHCATSQGVAVAMPIEDELAWNRWCRALDELTTTAEELRGLRHLSDNHPHKSLTWVKVKSAQIELTAAWDALNARVPNSRQRGGPP